MSVSVLVDNSEGLDAPLDGTEIASIVERVLAAEGIPGDIEVSIALVDDEAMRGLNRTWRGIDRATDVLSFECEQPGETDALLAGRPCELGDVILAPAIIAAQAARFHNTAADEFRLMLVHGLLHLLGYDHLEESEAETMEHREDRILQDLAVARGARGPRIAVAPTTRHASAGTGRKRGEQR